MWLWIWYQSIIVIEPNWVTHFVKDWATMQRKWICQLFLNIFLRLAIDHTCTWGTSWPWLEAPWPRNNLNNVITIIMYIIVVKSRLKYAIQQSCARSSECEPLLLVPVEAVGNRRFINRTLPIFIIGNSIFDDMENDPMWDFFSYILKMSYSERKQT